MLTVPGAAAITVSVLSASKAWNLAGLKCAVIVTASEEMASRVNLLPPDVRWRTGHFGVLATVAAFADGGSWLDELLSTLEQRRTLLTGLLHDRLPEVTWQAPEATFLAWLDCRAFGDGDEPRDRFLEAGRVALEPGFVSVTRAAVTCDSTSAPAPRSSTRRRPHGAGRRLAIRTGTSPAMPSQAPGDPGGKQRDGRYRVT